MTRLHQFAEHLEAHAMGIGFVCINWTGLEHVIDAGIAYLTDKPFSDVASHIFASHMEMSNKVQVLRALALVKKPDDPWFEEVNNLLNHIDQQLRAARNRVVHDLWRVDPESGDPPTRTYAKIRIMKAQSHQPRTLHTHEVVPVTVDDIIKLATSIDNASIHLLVLLQRVPGFKDALNIEE